MWKILRSAILSIILILATTCGMQSQAFGETDQATFIVT